MANQIGGDTWLVDTPGATILFKGWFRVKDIYWNGPAAAATFVITDINSNTLLSATFATGQQPYWGPEKWWHGLIVPTLTSGVLEFGIM